MHKPVLSQESDFLQGALLWEQVRRARNHDELFWAAKLTESLLVEVEDNIVVASNDEKGWRLNETQHVSGKIGTASPQDNGLDGCRIPRRG